MTESDHVKSVELQFKRRKISYTYVPFYAAIYTRGHGDSLRDHLQRATRKNRSGKGWIDWRKVSRYFFKALGFLLGRQHINYQVLQRFPGLEVDLRFPPASEKLKSPRKGLAGPQSES